MAPAFRLLDILQVLGRHEVDFILVGGVAAILEGAPAMRLHQLLTDAGPLDVLTTIGTNIDQGS